MKALQVSRARPSEDRQSFVRWAFPGLFLQEKGVLARRCRACLAARYQERACFARRPRLRSELADIWNGAGVLLITVLLYGGLQKAVGHTRPCISIG